MWKLDSRDGSWEAMQSPYELKNLAKILQH